jgi:hypothetical protein
MADAVVTNYGLDAATGSQTITVQILHKGVSISLTIPISPQAISQTDQLQEAQDWLRDFGQDLSNVTVVSPIGKTTP